MICTSEDRDLLRAKASTVDKTCVRYVHGIAGLPFVMPGKLDQRRLPLTNVSFCVPF